MGIIRKFNRFLNSISEKTLNRNGENTIFLKLDHSLLLRNKRFVN